MFRRIVVGVVLAFVFIWFLISPQIPTQAAAGSEVQARDGYTILYMTTRDETGDFFTPTSIKALFAEENVVISEELTELDHVDAIVVDLDSFESLPADAFQQVYQAGKVIAFLNAYAPEVEYLTGDRCIGMQGWMDGSDPYPADFYLIVAMKVTGSSEDVNTILNSAMNGNCSETQGVAGDAGIYTSRSQNSISNAEEWRIFKEVLLFEVRNSQSQ